MEKTKRGNSGTTPLWTARLGFTDYFRQRPCPAGLFFFFSALVQCTLEKWRFLKGLDTVPNGRIKSELLFSLNLMGRHSRKIRVFLPAGRTCRKSSIVRWLRFVPQPRISCRHFWLAELEALADPSQKMVVTWTEPAEAERIGVTWSHQCSDMP